MIHSKYCNTASGNQLCAVYIYTSLFFMFQRSSSLQTINTIFLWESVTFQYVDVSYMEMQPMYWSTLDQCFGVLANSIIHWYQLMSTFIIYCWFIAWRWKVESFWHTAVHFCISQYMVQFINLECQLLALTVRERDICDTVIKIS